ncbi:MAG: nucleotide exchange factor GrpE [Pseudomonadota bacterium]
MADQVDQSRNGDAHEGDPDALFDNVDEVAEAEQEAEERGAWAGGDEVEKLNRDAAAGALSEYKARYDELQGKHEIALRQLAEAENRRKQADREVEKARKFAVSKFAEDLLPVADSLEQALAHMPQDEELSDGVKGVLAGVELTHRNFLASLKSHGIERVEAEGAILDPNMHEAVQQMEDPSVPDGTILRAFRSGYMISDRLLRAALVVVATGGPRPESAAAQPDAAQSDVDAQAGDAEPQPMDQDAENGATPGDTPGA